MSAASFSETVFPIPLGSRARRGRQQRVGLAGRIPPHPFTEELCGCEVSSSDVSRATALLDEEFESWRNRPLGQVKYLILDARYEKVRQAGSVVDCAVLVAIGVDAQGRRSILGVSVSLSKAEAHWP